MDDNARNKVAYLGDQGILDARGIKMTVEEVAGLSTCKYSERVHSLQLSNEDLAFLKGLRRRIKNRLASQNSRRRSVEHLRRLTRELRAVRACRRDAIVDRRQLLLNRDRVRDKCRTLRRHLMQIMHDRCDSAEVPDIDVPESLPTELTMNVDMSPIETLASKSQKPKSQKLVKPQHLSVIVKNKDLQENDEVYSKLKELQDFEKRKTVIIKEERVFEDNTIVIKEEVFDEDSQEHSDSQSFDACPRDFGASFDKKLANYLPADLTNDIFECKIGKLVQQSVNHMFSNSDRKKVFAKTVFIADDTKKVLDEGSQVLNLSVKEGRRKSHGRKQSAPRRIACYADDDEVLDLKIKK